MTITQDFQGNIGTFTFGAGTVWRWRASGFQGLGHPPFRTGHMPRGLQVPGSATGQNVLNERMVTLPFMVTGSSTGAVQTNFQTLKNAWQPQSADVALDLRMPGMPETTMRLYGRPMGITGEKVDVSGRWIECIAQFFAADPFFYGSQVTTSGSAGSMTVTNAGDARSWRATVTVTPTAAAPYIINNSDPNSGYVRANTTLTSGSALTLDLQSQAVTYGGASRADLITAASPWFVLAAGTNTIAWSGASTVSITFRPAYH